MTRRISITAASIGAFGRSEPLSPIATGAPAVDRNHIPNLPDSGCDLSPSCLNCPLPVCKYDVAGPQRRAMLRRVKDQRNAAYIRDQGLSAPEAAAALGVTTRTVFRILARANNTAHVGADAPPLLTALLAA